MKKEQAEAFGEGEAFQAYAVTASPSATPDPSKMKAEYALLQTEWKAKQSALAAEQQRMEYEIETRTEHFRKRWEYKARLVGTRRKLKRSQVKRRRRRSCLAPEEEAALREQTS